MGPSLFAQPAGDPAGEGLLELPSFHPPSASHGDTSVTLELLPEEAPAAEVMGPPLPENQESPVDTAEQESLPAASPEVPQPQPDIASPDLQPEPSETILAEPVPAGGMKQYDEMFGPPLPPQLAATEPVARDSEDAGEPRQVAGSDLIGPQQPAVTADPQPVTETKMTIRDDVLQDGWDEGSVMFSMQEIRALQEAILKAKGIETEVVFEDLPETIAPAPVESAPPPPEYAAFYVNSILYFSPENWMVWINGKKFYVGKKSPLERVSVEAVDRKTVTFLWKPVSGQRPAVEPDARHIQLEPGGAVRLTLSANQTFLVPNMKLLEGRGITAEVKELLAMNSAAETAAMEAADNPQGASTIRVPDRDQQNVDKLVSQYRNAGNAMPKPASKIQ